MPIKSVLLKSLKPLLVGAVLTTSLFSPAIAFDDKEKEEIGSIVREYLLNNPEILYEMQQEFERKREEEANAKAQVALERDHDKIFNSPNQITLGNPKGDVTVVEFYDYNCGYCKRAMNDMQKLLEEDGNIRFVLKEFPIFQGSGETHQVSVAVSQVAPEKYQTFHSELFSLQGQKTAERALNLADKLGIDTNKIKEAMSSDKVLTALQENAQLGQALSINGTPAYVFEGQVVSGAVGFESLKTIVSNMRECGKTNCS